MSNQDTFSQDVRKEQIALLRFEKQLVAMAETLAAGSLTASSTDEKLQTREASIAYKKMKKALQNLADETGCAHETLMNRAVKSNGRFIEFDQVAKPETSGVKREIAKQVKSTLSLSKPQTSGVKREVAKEVKSTLSTP